MKKDPAILHLNLHREFFAAIAAGTKKTEYRARTPCWTQLASRRGIRISRSCCFFTRRNVKPRHTVSIAR
jgi:hypothetical protein